MMFLVAGFQMLKHDYIAAFSDCTPALEEKQVFDQEVLTPGPRLSTVDDELCIIFDPISGTKCSTFEVSFSGADS